MGRPALALLLAGSLASAAGLWPPHAPATRPALDMAPDSFDDQYLGCSRLMEEELAELNRTEFATNEVYARTWAAAAAEWGGRRVPGGLRPQQAVAITAYTLHGPLFQEFNKAVREAGRSRREYLDSFPFKVLHFLLTQATRALRDPRPRSCHRVYRGLRGVRFTARPGQTVRLGHFASSSFSELEAKEFGEDTFFSVYTCYGVPIKDFSRYPQEEEVLIPPFERFRVISATLQQGRALINLSSDGTFSNYNCELVKERRCRDSPCVFSTGRSIPGDPSPRLWGLLLAAAALAATGTP